MSLCRRQIVSIPATLEKKGFSPAGRYPGRFWWRQKLSEYAPCRIFSIELESAAVRTSTKQNPIANHSLVVQQHRQKNLRRWSRRLDITHRKCPPFASKEPRRRALAGILASDLKNRVVQQTRSICDNLNQPTTRYFSTPLISTELTTLIDFSDGVYFSVNSL
jgi:hypothetical protein